jgi:esterase/lipase
MSKKTWILVIILGIVSLYSIGPSVDKPVFTQGLPVINGDLISMEDSINNSEYYTKDIKYDNQARIVWNDSLSKKKTPISIVYLHGFTASGEEGNPTHRKFAERYGCNLYISRLNYHGIGGENQLEFMTAEGLYEDTKRAIAIGKRLGDEVILMSTSTGGTLALYYVANHNDIKGIINYSPNVRIKQKASYFTDKNWGLQLTRFVFGGKYKIDECAAYDLEYWNCKTRLEAVIELQSLVDNTMTKENFKKITTPSFTGYYYKDKKDEDPTVSVEAIRWINKNFGTDSLKTRAIAFPNAGTHVIANKIKSNAWQEVYNASCDFAEEVLKMQPLNEKYNQPSFL